MTLIEFLDVHYRSLYILAFFWTLWLPAMWVTYKKKEQK